MQSLVVQRLCGFCWQVRFFDRALRSVKQYYKKVEYIHLNPEGAGLVKRAEEWHWSSGHEYTGGLRATLRPNRTLAIEREGYIPGWPTKWRGIGKQYALGRSDRLGHPGEWSLPASSEANFRVARHPPRIAASACGNIRNHVATRHF